MHAYTLELMILGITFSVFALNVYYPAKGSSIFYGGRGYEEFSVIFSWFRNVGDKAKHRLVKYW